MFGWHVVQVVYCRVWHLHVNDAHVALVNVYLCGNGRSRSVCRLSTFQCILDLYDFDLSSKRIFEIRYAVLILAGRAFHWFALFVGLFCFV